MSFILDALKKSENERQRQIGPSLADVRISRRHNDRPWWVIAVAALLVVNLGVLIIVLSRGGEVEPAALPARDAQAHGSSSPAAGPRADARHYDERTGVDTGTRAPGPDSASRALSDPGVRSLAYEADPYAGGDASGIPNPHLAAAAAVPDGPPMVRPIDAPTVAPLPSGLVIESRVAQSADEQVPLMSDVIARGTPLPDLHLDIHVYSGDPAERFVFVNMRKYTEGQLLNEGPAVEKITPGGVVLNQRGVRFLLPRP